MFETIFAAPNFGKILAHNFSAICYGLFLKTQFQMKGVALTFLDKKDYNRT